jgi:hypothetical protein
LITFEIEVFTVFEIFCVLKGVKLLGMVYGFIGFGVFKKFLALFKAGFIVSFNFLLD